MAAQPVTHPSADALRAFALGKLNDLSSAELMNHLDSCPDCCKQVAALSGDDFLHRLRQAHGRSFTPAPAKALSGTAETALRPKPSANQTPIPNLPPELANNPQYQIIRELGRGGMGVVYLAKNKLMGRLEVLKVVNKALLNHPAAVERFLREIRAAAKLSHPNVVAAYSAVQIGELLAFAMEYIEGQDLASLVKSQGPLPIVNACYYVQQAALGLQHAFEKGMVHRDIKPQNLILAREGKKHIVKVLDFGLAKATREKKDDSGLTGEGKMLGTPDYIAPEQTLDAAKADIRADIYSLGCTLYYLLSGHPPFSASSLGAMLLAHQMHEARPLNLERPEVPEELAAVVRRMVAKSPAKRYQTPLEVVQALSPFVKQGATAKPSPELSSGLVEVKLASKEAVPVDPPPVPVAELRRKQPAPANVWKSLTEDSIVPVKSLESGLIRKRRAATGRKQRSQKKWLLGGGIGVGVLLLALLGMWAGGVIMVKTPEGTIVLENLPAEAEVLVDGAKVIVKWDKDGKTAQLRVPQGKHKIEATKDGIKVIGDEVEIQDGKRLILRAKLDHQSNPLKTKEGQAPSTPRVAKTEKAPEPFNPRPVDSSRPTTPRNDYDSAARATKRFPVGFVLPAQGEWMLEGDELVQSSKANRNTTIVFGDPDWGDYDFSLEAKMVEGRPGFVLIFRDREPADPKRYEFALDGANQQAYIRPTGEKWGDRSYHHNKAEKLVKDRWYQLEVQVRGQQYDTYLDGQKIFSFTADDLPPKGRVGLVTWATTCRFRNIVVKDPKGTILLEGLPDL